MCHRYIDKWNKVSGTKNKDSRNKNQGSGIENQETRNMIQELKHLTLGWRILIYCNY